MMIRLLHLVSVLAVIAAGGILTLCVTQWRRSDCEPCPPACSTQPLQPRGAVHAGTEERLSPLMAAAQGFASYLAPPPPPVQDRPTIQGTSKPAVPVVRPSAALPQFKVRGTICAGPLEQSIALICEPGASEAGRWMKEGTHIGHFTIHEIRPGSIVYLDGDKLCEMAIERGTASTMAVASDSGSPAVSHSQKTVGDARPTQTSDRTKRPTRNSGFTVGSPRTRTID
jgi:hypothetical protein